MGAGAGAPAAAAPWGAPVAPLGPSLMVPGTPGAPGSDAAPAPRPGPAGPPAGSTLSGTDAGRCGPQGGPAVAALQAALAAARATAGPARARELHDADSRLASLAWALSPEGGAGAGVSPGALLAVSTFGAAAGRGDAAAAQAALGTLARAHFEECPWLPALKRVAKLGGL